MIIWMGDYMVSYHELYATETFMLLYVNSVEKRTGMKNTGLKIPEKDQIYVEVGFSYYLRAKIIGEFYCSLF